MKDLIDRQAAIDALIDALAWTWSGTWSEKTAIDAIKNLPSAEPDVPDTNVGDLISRQAAIDAIGKDVMGGLNYEGILKRLPSAQPEQRWIPCSERLPRKKCRYMVTRYDYVTKKEFIDIMWYEKKIWWNVHPMGGDYAVTAWMPLPEPHKEDNR